MPKQEGKVYVIGEIGINHNGSLELAKDLIRACRDAGCDAVKFQKRDVDLVYTKDELAAARDHPFGKTNGDLKRHLEFDKDQFDVIDQYCADMGVDWFASPWDLHSAEFLYQYNPPYMKIASACLTNKELLHYCAHHSVPLIISTGMADLPLIHKAVDQVILEGGHIACIMHCTSTYPAKKEELNLFGIKTLQAEFPAIPIGYSGHEAIVPTTIMAMALGADFIERHVTTDRTMFGSDQAASLEPEGIRRVCSAARAWEVARGDGNIRIYNSEVPVAKKLRRVNTL